MVQCDFTQYDYIDLGCSEGRSIAFGREKFLGERGLGLDKSEVKAETARKAGHDVICCDVLQFDPSPHKFNFVTADHLLEHLPSLEDVTIFIAALPRLAKHFAYLATPSFEGEPYLKELGLCQYWMKWVGHPTHITISDYLQIFSSLNFTKFEIECVGLLAHSSHATILPYASPLDQVEYCEATHGPKPSLYFQEKIFREIQVLLQMPGCDPSVWKRAVACFRRSIYEYTLPLHLHRLEMRKAHSSSRAQFAWEKMLTLFRGRSQDK